MSVFNVPRFSFNFRSLFWVLAPNDEINVDARVLSWTGFILFALAYMLISSFLSYFLFASCALDQRVPLLFDLLFASKLCSNETPATQFMGLSNLFLGKMFFCHFMYYLNLFTQNCATYCFSNWERSVNKRIPGSLYCIVLYDELQMLGTLCKTNS